MFVELDDRLGEVEIDGPAPIAPAVENEGQFLHQLELLHQVAVARGGGSIAGEDGVYRRVSHALGAAKDSRQQLISHHAAFRINLHERRHRQAVDVWVEAADPVGKFQRQHGHGAVGEIDGGSAQPRLAVERHAGTNIMGDVGDVHLENIVAVEESLDVNGVVEIFCRLAVYRHNGKRAKIPPPFAFRLGDVLRLHARISQHFGGKAMRQVILANDDLNVDAELVTRAQNFNHPAARKSRGAGKVGELDVYDQILELAGAPTGGDRQPAALPFRLPAKLPVANPRRFRRRPLLPARDHNLERNAVVVGQDVVVARPATEFAHHAPLRPLDDAHDASFEPAVCLGSNDVNLNAVAVHR